jgi:hypothetical protein
MSEILEYYERLQDVHPSLVPFDFVPRQVIRVAEEEGVPAAFHLTKDELAREVREAEYEARLSLNYSGNLLLQFQETCKFLVLRLVKQKQIVKGVQTRTCLK